VAFSKTRLFLEGFVFGLRCSFLIFPPNLPPCDDFVYRDGRNDRTPKDSPNLVLTVPTLLSALAAFGGFFFRCTQMLML